MSSSRNSSHRTSVDLSSSKQKSTASTDGTLATGLADLGLNTFAKRPGFGSLGKKVDARVNLFRMSLDRVPDLIEYNIKFCSIGTSNREASRRIKRRAIFLLLDRNPCFKDAASDYANVMISTKPLTPTMTTNYTYAVEYFEEEERDPRSESDKQLCRITLSFTRIYQTQALLNHQNNQLLEYPLLEQHIAACNIILARDSNQNLAMTNTARRETFFDITENNGCQSLGHGLNVYKGYFRSARLTMNGFMVNLNTAASAMYCEGPLHHLIASILDEMRFKDLKQRIAYLSNQLKFLKVETMYMGKPVRKTIYNIPLENEDLKPTSRNIYFQKDGRSVSVEEHFEQTYPATRRNDLDAVVVNVGSRARPVYIPSDLCFVPRGQPYRGLLPRSSQTATMIKFACRPPAHNVKLILHEGLKQMGVGVPNGSIERFKLQIVPQMTQVTARLLPPPTLLYRSGSDARIGTGSWNMANKKFRIPPPTSNVKFTYFEMLLKGTSSALNRVDFCKFMQQSIRLYTDYAQAQMQTIEGFEHSRILPDDFGPSNMKKVFDYLLG